MTTPARIGSYRNLIKQNSDRYGPVAWAVIYQADVRARMEHTERTRKLGEAKLLESQSLGGQHAFDPKTVWEWVRATCVLAPKVGRKSTFGASQDHHSGQPAGWRRPDWHDWLNSPFEASIHKFFGNLNVRNFVLLTTNRRSMNLCRRGQDGTCQETDCWDRCIRNGGEVHLSLGTRSQLFRVRRQWKNKQERETAVATFRSCPRRL